MTETIIVDCFVTAPRFHCIRSRRGKRTLFLLIRYVSRRSDPIVHHCVQIVIMIPLSCYVFTFWGCPTTDNVWADGGLNDRRRCRWNDLLCILALHRNDPHQWRCRGIRLPEVGVQRRDDCCHFMVRMLLVVNVDDVTPSNPYMMTKSCQNNRHYRCRSIRVIVHLTGFLLH